MPVPEYTTIVGVDYKHLQQLSWTWPTWKKNKPSILNHPMIVFRDHEQVSEASVRTVVDHPNLTVHPWPYKGIEYEGTPGDRWADPQRHKMLTGFVFIPALYVETPYWLKLDTDVIAQGQDDWIDPDWFQDDPAIVSHPWSFTKPADQMFQLDRWVTDNWGRLLELNRCAPLNLWPKPGSERLNHKRIISWCSFYRTDFTQLCADTGSRVCGPCKMPVPSQDGFVFYIAKRMGLEIRRVNMKRKGWLQRLTKTNIERESKLAMGDER